jgi:chromosome segregation ATPase
MLQEKIESSSKLSRLQRDYDKAEEECQKYRTLYENLKQEHSQQVTKLNEAVKLAESASKEIEEKNKDEMEQLLTSKEVLQVDLDFTKNELSVTKVKLKETNEQLENLRYQLELNPSKVTNVIENAVVNDTGSSESGYVKHGTESLENGEINEAVKQEQVTLLESADPHSTLLVSSAKENEVLKVRLTASEERIKSLVDEIDNLKLSSTDSERQFERLRGQLQEKSLSEQNKTNEIMELTSTIEQQRSELENLRSEWSFLLTPNVCDLSLITKFNLLNFELHEICIVIIIFTKSCVLYHKKLELYGIKGSDNIGKGSGQ